MKFLLNVSTPEGTLYFCQFQPSWGRSINLPWLCEARKLAFKSSECSLCSKSEANDHRLNRISASVGCYSIFYNWVYDIVVTEHFLCVITSSYGDSTNSLLAREDWIPQLYEWPLLHSSLLCSAPAEMQLQERICKAERQTPSSWDHCLGIDPNRHLHMKGP